MTLLVSNVIEIIPKMLNQLQFQLPLFGMQLVEGMHSSINGILIKILQSSWVLIATSKMRSILLLNFMSKKNNPSSYKHSPDSPPSSRSPSPGDSSSSRGSNVDGDGFTVVGGRMRRHRSEWNSRREKLHKDLRIMEYSLVLASVMMKELNTPEIVARNCYFGRYGPVEKVIISSKHSTYNNKGGHVQAFVTYRNEKDTAFAIIAVRNLPHHKHFQLKAHYGTSRYCPYFISDSVCQYTNCFFNHQVRDNHAHKDELKGTVERQHDRAVKIIDKNLEYFVEKEYQQFKNRDKMDQEVTCSCGRYKEKITFPSCKDVLKKLIAQGCIKQADYDAAKAKIKDKYQRVRCSSLQVQNKENKEMEGKPQECSPVKKVQKPQSHSLSPVSQHASNDSTFPALPLQLAENKAFSHQEKQTFMTKKSSKRSAMTLEEYIEHNILDDYDDKEPPQLQLPLTERLKVEKPFLGDKMGEVLGYSQCQVQGLNPEVDVCSYLINKIVRRTFTRNKMSRFQFAGWIDRKTQAYQQRKLREIIGKKLIN